LGSRIVRGLLADDSVLPVQELRVLDIKDLQGITDDRLTFINGDVRDQTTVNEACLGVDGVIHSAALVDWGANRPEVVYDINFNGTKNLIDACKGNGVRALVSTSSVDAIYTGKPLRDIDELEPYPKKYPNMYGQSKSEAEQLVISNNTSSLSTCTIRPADIWGEGDPYHLEALFNMAKSGFYVRLGDGKSKCQHVYVGNCAHAHVLALKALLDGNENVEGQAYFITDGLAGNFFEFFDQIVLQSGQRVWPKNLWLPKWFAYGIGAISELIAWLVRPIKYYNPNFSRFAVNYTCTDLIFTSEKAKRDFGFENKYEVEEAIERTARYYSG